MNSPAAGSVSITPLPFRSKLVLSPPSGRRRHDARSFAILGTDPWAPGARSATQTSPFRSIAVRLGLFAWLVVKNATPPSVRPKPSIGTTLIPSHLVAGLGIKLGDRARARVGNPGEVKRGAVVAQDDSAIRPEGDSIPRSIRSTIEHEVTRAVVVGNAAVKRG